MLGVIGDIHGNLITLHALVNETKNIDQISACIQVGDFGVSPSELDYFKLRSYSFAKPTYVIDGNHEDFDHLMSFSEVTELLPNLFYVPRGTILNLDNRVVAFLGGAGSIDKKIRLEAGMNWDDRENIREEEVNRLFDNLEKMGNPKVDLLIVHDPPLSIVEKNFRAENKLFFGVGIDWVDHNMSIIERVWGRLNHCDMACGHMHKSVQFGSNSYILGIQEFRCM